VVEAEAEAAFIIFPAVIEIKLLWRAASRGR